MSSELPVCEPCRRGMHDECWVGTRGAACGCEVCWGEGGSKAAYRRALGKEPPPSPTSGVVSSPPPGVAVCQGPQSLPDPAYDAPEKLGETKNSQPSIPEIRPLDWLRFTIFGEPVDSGMILEKPRRLISKTPDEIPVCGPCRESKHLSCIWRRPSQPPCGCKTCSNAPRRSTPKMYLVRPGAVRSKNDGQEHYVSAPQLMRLYGVRRDECIVDDSRHPMREETIARLGLTVLAPRYAGDYRLPDKETPMMVPEPPSSPIPVLDIDRRVRAVSELTSRDVRLEWKDGHWQATLYTKASFSLAPSAVVWFSSTELETVLGLLEGWAGMSVERKGPVEGPWSEEPV